MVVAPRRHVEQVDDLSPAEQALLGPLVAEVAQALRAETPTARVYVGAFGEILPHLHVHVIARPPGLPAAEQGPALFAAEPPVAAAEARTVSDRVLARLAAAKASPPMARLTPAWRAALLSALVCPGAGQIRNGQKAKGLALVAVTLAGAGYVLFKLVQLVVVAMPPAGLVDPIEALDLATALVRQVKGELSWLTTALVAIWIYSIADAWFGARPQR
jgi:diadenosine tetraphosphate (Ap4A) HIT family hydrolase